MGLFGSIMNKMESLSADAMKEMKKFLNEDVMIGTMAACAMVANANGEIKTEEKKKIIGIIQRNETLKNYDTDVVINHFKKFIDDYVFDADIAEGICLKAIKKITGQEQKEILVRECIAIGKADGDFDRNEKEVVKKICRTLGINTRIVE